MTGGSKEGLGRVRMEFRAPFNTCSSQRDLEKGEGLGRRWQGRWSLVLLWHMGNLSWFPTVPLSDFALLLEPLSACNHLFCLPLCFSTCLFLIYTSAPVCFKQTFKAGNHYFGNLNLKSLNRLLTATLPAIRVNDISFIENYFTALFSHPLGFESTCKTHALTKYLKSVYIFSAEHHK